MTEASVLSFKNQLTLPRRVREDLGAKRGDVIVFIPGEEMRSWTLLRLPGDPVEALRFLGKNLGGTPEEVHREFEEAWEER